MFHDERYVDGRRTLNAAEDRDASADDTEILMNHTSYV